MPLIRRYKVRKALMQMGMSALNIIDATDKRQFSVRG